MNMASNDLFKHKWCYVNRTRLNTVIIIAPTTQEGACRVQEEQAANSSNSTCCCNASQNAQIDR